MIQSDYQKTKEDFKEYLKSKQFTTKSIQSRLVVFSQYQQWMDKENLEPEQVSYNDLLMFMKYCNKTGKTQRTIRHYMTIVRHFYDHLIREEQINTNPAADITVKGVKRKVLYHILEPHELNKLYNDYEAETIKRRRNKVMLGLLIYQGLRTEELEKLEVKKINLREGKIEILGSKKSVGRELRLEAHQVMEMYDYVLKTRNEILEMNPKRKSQNRQETGKLFIGEGGNCYSVSNFMTQLMIRLRKQNPHVLNAKQIRASVITKWLKIYNLREVQYLAGHRYISSTEQYLQNDLEGLQEEVQKFHPLGLGHPTIPTLFAACCGTPLVLARGGSAEFVFLLRQSILPGRSHRPSRGWLKTKRCSGPWGRP